MRIRRLAHPDAGGVMLAALGVVIMVSALGACLLQLSNTISRRQVLSVDNKRAFYLAEAGLSEAVFGLVSGKTGNIATPERPASFGRGVFWVESTYLENGRTSLKSTGCCGVGRASLSIVVEKTKASVASLGVFGDQSVTVKTGALVDSWDSRVGPYVAPAGPPAAGAPAARLGSNGNISVTGATRTPTKIYGDAIPGQKGTVTSTSGVTISGSTAPIAQPISLPKIQVPTLSTQGSIIHSGATPRTITGGSQRFDEIEAQGTSKIILQGPLELVVDRLKMPSGTTLQIDASAGPVTIYATDAFWLSSGSTLTCTAADPSKISVLVPSDQVIDRNGDGVADQPLITAATGTFNGSLYAPLAALTLPSTLQVFGALGAKSISIEASAKVHFDRALKDLARGDESDPSLIAWRIVELPNTPLVTLRLDPVAVLKAQGVVTPAPNAAQETLDFKIEYVGLDGKRHTWEGSEAKFNWSLVLVATRTLRTADVGFLAGL